jgi:geranylgeranyl pyrophosphate synthase
MRRRAEAIGAERIAVVGGVAANSELRAALAGGPLDGALLRVAETDALESSRKVALDYARQARACLDGHLRREELEALTDAVVDRES